MAWDESFICNICGTVKLESNHWWMITLGKVLCFDEGQPSQRFTLLPWNEDQSRNRMSTTSAARAVLPRRWNGSCLPAI